MKAKTIFQYVSVAALVYILFVIVNVDFNITNWSKDMRFFMVLVWTIYLFVFIFIKAMNIHKDEE